MQTFAQQATVRGKIRSAIKGEALPGVSILVNEIVVSVSGLDGSYQLLIDSGNHILTFRYISFIDHRNALRLKENEMLVLDIYMEESIQELDIIVISAAKFEQRLEEVTVSMDVMKPSMLEERNFLSMDEALQNMSGVSIVDGQANIRGGSGWSYGAGSRVQILVDDLPQLTADANDTKWNFLPVENLEQVEIIKGASSVLFGSSALNGAINIRTAYPREKPLTKINTFTGIYDHAKYEINDTSYRADWWGNTLQSYSGLNFLHSRKAGQVDVVVGGNMFLDEGYRRGEYENRARINSNLRYRFKNIEGLSAGININSMTSDGNLFFLWKSDTNGAYIPAPNTLSGYTNYRTNIDPFITYISKKGHSHKIRTRWFNTSNQNNTNQDSKADLYYGEYQYQHRFGNSVTMTGGLVSQSSRVRSELYGNHEGSQHAAYLQSDFNYKRLNVSIGGRLEQNTLDAEKDDVTSVFRSGVNYRIHKATFLRSSYGQGYRFPSIAEKYVSTSVGNLVIYPNKDLGAEKGYSAEFGVRQLLRGSKFQSSIDIAIFENRYQNMMEFGFAQWGNLTDPLFGLGFRSMNVGDTRIRGLEIGWSGTATLFKVKNYWNVGYTYLDPRQLSYDSLYITKVGFGNHLGSDSSDFLKYRSRHLLKADIGFEWKKLSAGIGFRYHSHMVNIDKIFVSGLLDFAFDQSLGIKHYRDHRDKGDMIVDLRMAYQVRKELRISFVVKNLFNRIYMERPADMQPPRIFVLQASLEF